MVSPSTYPVLANLSSAVGGAELQQSFIARGLRDLGYSVSLISADYGQPDDFEYEGIRIIKAIRRGRELPFVRYVHPGLSSIWASAAKANADVYYQRCAGPATAVAGLYARYSGRKFVYAGAHDYDFKKDETWRLFRNRTAWRSRHLFQLGLRLADIVVAQHPGQAAACQRWYGLPSVVIPNCYAPPPESRATPGGVILWVAVMRDIKRPGMFLELARALPQYRFRMIGGPGVNPTFFEDARAQASRLPNVDFLGFVPIGAVEDHFNQASIVINTSVAEGFPNTFLQAWSRGIPTVSFIDVGARRNGQPVGSVVSDLDEMIRETRRLREDDIAWSAKSHCVRDYFVENHSADAVISRYTQLLEGLSERTSPEMTHGAS